MDQFPGPGWIPSNPIGFGGPSGETELIRGRLCQVGGMEGIKWIKWINPRRSGVWFVCWCFFHVAHIRIGYFTPPIQSMESESSLNVTCIIFQAHVWGCRVRPHWIIFRHVKAGSIPDWSNRSNPLIMILLTCHLESNGNSEVAPWTCWRPGKLVEFPQKLGRCSRQLFSA